MDRRCEAKTSRTAKAVAAASDDALCTLLSAGLRVQAGEDRWRVIGNTLVFRLLLREAGGTWNKLDQCWEFSGDDPTTRLASALEARPAGAGHNADAAEPQPHYHGHRGRVRERVMRAGAELLEDYELLELLLFYSIERIDTKPLAKRLLDRFGTLGDVFAAEPAQLREFDIDQRTLVLFKASREAGRRLAERKVKDMPVLTNWQQLIDYCHTALAHEKTEQFRILFLDRKNVLIADEVQQRGTIDHTPVGHCDPRSPGDRSQGPCELPEPRAAHIKRQETATACRFHAYVTPAHRAVSRAREILPGGSHWGSGSWPQVSVD